MATRRREKAKKKIGFYWDAEFVTDFHRFVAERYGSVEGGLLSQESEAAMRTWMNTHRNTQTQKLVGPNPIPRVNIVREQVKDYLKSELGYTLIHEVPLKHLREAIGAVRGTDNRTIVKWITTFEKYHLIKWMSPQVVEFL